MAANEFGFDEDLDYTRKDNPFWDSTDGAHPAFLRGQDRAMEVVTNQLKTIVLGLHCDDEVTYPQVREKIRQLMDENMVLKLKLSPWEQGLQKVKQK